MDAFNPIDVNPFDSWGPFLVETGYTYFPASPMFSPFEMIQPFEVFDEYYVNDVTYNTTPPLPLGVEPLGAIMPFTPSDEYVMNDDATLSATPPLPLVVEPLQAIVPSTASDESVMNDVENNMRTTPLPLVVEPLGAIQPFTISEEDFNDETSNSATPPIPLDSHTGAIILYVGSNNNSYVPAVNANPSPVQEIKRRRGRPKGSKNKRKPHVPPLEAQVGEMVSYIGSNANTPVAANADADPTTVPVLEKKRGRPKGSPNPKTSNKKPKTDDPARRFVKSCPNLNSEITDAERANGNKELVDSVLMRFDAVRRRSSQLGDVKCSALNAYTICNRLGVRTNKKRRIGPVPGVEVGDIFYGWGEMNLVGLHLATVAGIDYLTKKDAAPEGGVATSVVSSGRYDDETEDVNCLVYTGHGGADKKGVPNCDQKLERGNLAMKTSHEKGNDVRVIRGVPDPRNPGKKIFIYDGLYKVVGFDKVKNHHGFAQFKFTLLRKQTI
ncbi:unnamed protein product [Arabis nemorensis]|uniref:YDG domain-containing protein n=1 Tax=Arabis nemorensis TaxID=586526 RepID=A0A565ARN2_9BRAS|nr:unnamed protein product [Arabis nemorensis]